MNLIPLRVRLIALLLLVLSGCATHVPRPQSANPAAQITAASAVESWARVLTQFVNTKGEVDFSALAASRKDLDTYVSYIAETKLASLPTREARLAHLINSYNALSMFNVIHLGIPQTNAAASAKLKFFFLQKYEIGGERMSLYAFENDIIRKEGDARVHWALNCSAVGCPVLPRVPFTAGGIEGELQREAKLFFADAKNLRVDHIKKEIGLSEIFWLFPEDFVPKFAPSFAAYAQLFISEKLPAGYAERKIPYDWTIANSRRESK
jgi:Protein of unknown function, DUF547